MRSRVMPGSLVTIERRVAVRRLKSVDLPTLGRPTITMDGSLGVMATQRYMRASNIIMVRSGLILSAHFSRLGEKLEGFDGSQAACIFVPLRASPRKVGKTERSRVSDKFIPTFWRA